MKTKTMLIKAADIVENVVTLPLMFMGALMVLVVLVGTFWRYILNDPILWTEEVSRYLMIWLGLLGASVSLKRREHVSFLAVINLFPVPVRKVILLITKIFIGYFFYILTKEGWILAVNAGAQLSPALKISMFWPLLSVPLSGGFMLIQLVLQILIDLSDMKRAIL